MLEQIRKLGRKRADFAFESTLAGRSYANLLRELLGTGYEAHVLYFWLQSADIAVNRIRDRVHRGGHHVPEDDVRHRYVRSHRNFVELYHPLATTWSVFDNSFSPTPLLLASGGAATGFNVAHAALWEQFERGPI
jgi:predicted ABC-type ATPase